MRCLYCGKELALLKRLRGGGEFCSEAHKQSYQEEYDKIALSRLLQAQKKVPATGAESTQTSRAETPPAARFEKTQTPTSPPSTAAAEERPPTRTAEPETEEIAVAQVEAPSEPAGFLLEKPGQPEFPTEFPDAEPYLESWVVASQSPALPQGEAAAPTLSKDLAFAGLVPMRPTSESSGAELVVSANQFAIEGLPPEDGRPAMPTVVTIALSANPLPFGGITDVDVPTRGLKVMATAIAVAEFPGQVEFGGSVLCALLPDQMEAPEGDPGANRPISRSARSVIDSSPSPVQASTDSFAPVAVLERVEEPIQEMPANGARASREPDEERSTPHATLEALSRLHQVMQSQASPVPDEEPVAVAVVEPAPVERQEESATQEESAAQEPSPREASNLLDIPIKIITPSKRGARVVTAISPAVPALVPRLKALPLRPKVAPAPAQAVPDAQAKVVQPVTPAMVSKVKPPSTVPAQANSVSKPEQPQTKSKGEEGQPSPVSKATAFSKPASGLKSAPAPKAAQSKSVDKKQQPGKPAEPAAKKSPAPTQTVPPTEAAKDGATAKSAPREATAESAAKPKPAEAAKKSEPAKPSVSDDALPSFGSIGRQTGFWASLKVKIGIGALLVAAGGAAYLGLGGKSQKQPAASAASAGDGAGPSIILGEGGWVVGWGGDSISVNSGKEITIYRPSLKLSNYRIEFQGDIETNSMGWIFRAADPENYYAMKLTTVSTGVSPKVALFKYIVVKGRQTQVGRVPISADVRNDTVFKVRVDVRGPKFSTYIQGQPVDVWTDDQLKAGGVGFLNERGERGRIKSVSIRYLTGDDQ